MPRGVGTGLTGYRDTVRTAPRETLSAERGVTNADWRMTEKDRREMLEMYDTMEQLLLPRE